MFKTIGIIGMVVAALSFLFEWGLTRTGLMFGLGFLAIAAVLEPKPR